MVVGLHTVGMVVGDMAASVAFFRLLGLSIPEGEEHAPHVEITSSTGLTLGLDTEEFVAQSDPHWQAPRGGQRVNLQFQCASPADVDATYTRLTGGGAGEYLAPMDAFWGQRFARVTDPDGNVVSLFAPL